MAENKPMKSGRELSDLELSTLENIGNNVKFTRRNLVRVTLNEMARFTGVSRDVLCRLEAFSVKGVGEDTSYPSISTVIKFCEGVGVTPAELLSENFRTNTEIQEKVLEACKSIVSTFDTLEIEN